MSMNLRCESPSGVPFDLWGTPTDVTYDILYGTTGERRNPDESLEEYINWCVKRVRERRIPEDALDDHIQKLREFRRKYGPLKFSAT